MNLGFLGTGTISSAVVRGIARDGHTIRVSSRGARHAAGLANEFANVSVAENDAVVMQSDVVFIGLMADTARAVLPGLAFRAEHTVVSLMAGADLAEVAGLVAPAREVSVMIPFPGIAQGGSPILLRGPDRVVRALFGQRNTVFELATDQELAAYQCAQAVLSPAVRLVGDAAAWLGERVDDADQAEAFLRMLVASSLETSECTPLIEALNTPGGYNQRLRLTMEDSGMRDALRAALDTLERS